MSFQGTKTFGMRAIILVAVFSVAFLLSAPREAQMQAFVPAPLSVSLLQPSNGATVSGDVPLQAQVTGEGTPASVTFHIMPGTGTSGSSATIPGSQSGDAGGWHAVWATGSIANGSWKVKAVAVRAGDGSTSESPIHTVTVNNEVALSATVTSPASGTVLTGTVGLAASTSTSADSLSFVLSGPSGSPISVAASPSGSGKTSWTASWNSAEGVNGSYTIVARAFRSGIFVDSAGVGVTVDNPESVPLSVSVTSPTNGATASGSVSFSATTNVTATSLSFEIKNGAGAVVATPPANASNSGTTWTATWDSTASANGAYSVRAIAVKPGATANSTPVSFNVNNTAVTPPLAVTVVSPSNGASISGSVSLGAATNQNVDSLSFIVTREFGDHLQTTIPASGSGSTWSATWNAGSLPNGNYSVIARASKTGQTTDSPSVAFTLANPSPAPSEPELVVTLTAPTNGATVSGTVGLAASTNVTASSVMFIVRSGSSVAASISAASTGTNAWGASLTTTALANGTYTIVARGTKDGTTVDSTAATVTVSNAAAAPPAAPVVTMTSPPTTTGLTGTVSLSATADQAVDAMRFVISRSGIDPATIHGTGNETHTVWSAPWNTLSVPNGDYVITAIATKGGQQASSAPRTVKVANVTISVSIASPSNGATITGTREIVVAAVPSAVSVTIKIVKSTDAGVASTRIAIYDASRQVWTTQWRSNDVPNGQYRIEAQAKDSNGQTFTASPILVNVSNAGTPPAEQTFAIRMASPAAGATVSGQVPFAAAVTGTAVTVQFFVAPASGGSAVKVDGRFDAGRGLWVGTWDSTTHVDGGFQVGAVALDANNRRAEGAKIAFTLRNGVTAPPPSTVPPPFSVRLLAPPDGAAAGNVRFVAAVEGRAAEVSILLRRRGEAAYRTLRASFDSSVNRWVAVWNSDASEIGTYEALAFARNSDGREATSPNIVTLFIERQGEGPVTEPTPAPSETPSETPVEKRAAFIRPLAGANVSGFVPLVAKANFAAPRAVFVVRPRGGAAVATLPAVFSPTIGAWAAAWNSSASADGEYVIEAAIIGADGSRTTAETFVKLVNASDAPVESVPPIPIEVIKDLAQDVPEGATPVALERLPGGIAETQAALDAECAANGIPAERCEAWLAMRHQADECRNAGIITKEECYAFLKAASGGEFPGCIGKTAAECAQEVARKTAGLLSDFDLRVLREAITPHIGTTLVLTPPEAAPEPGAEGKVPPPVVAEAVPLRPARPLSVRVHASQAFGVTEDGDARQSVPAVLLIDTDEDGLPDDVERRLRTDPASKDTDEDGFDDITEIRNGYNPTGRGRLVDAVDLAPIEVAIVSGTPLEQPLSAGRESADLTVESAVPTGETQTLILTGRARPGEIVTIFLYSYLPVVLTAQAGEDGTWSYELGSALTDGEHEAYVTVTDDTGKIKEKSSPLAFFVASAQAATAEEFFAPEEESPMLAAQLAEPAQRFGGWFIVGAIALVLLALGIAAMLFMPRKTPPTSPRA